MEDPEIISSSKPIHVYISFRGDDSDTSRFVRDLSAALQRKGLITFGDDKKLEAIRDSNNIPPHLLQAIKQAWIRIVVFSKNYASSLWCLEELSSVVPRIHAHMLRPAPAFHVDPFFAELEEKNWFEAYLDKVNTWRLAMNQEAHRSGRFYVPYRFISVFYDVDPETFAQQEETYSYGDLDKVRRWRRDMKEVARIGLDVRNFSKSQVIQKIVTEAKTKIDKIFYGFFSFVGMQSRVEQVEKLLDLGSDDIVRVVGICGMSGLGKSSIATVLYLKIFHNFDAFSFLPNVSRRLKHGDLSLQELLCRNLETENPGIRDILEERFLTCESLRNQKILMVLDGVDLVNDIEELNLDEKSDHFGRGSRIIITTRDEQVLEMSKVDAIYRPELLTKDEASQLFHSKAFTRDYPIKSDFLKMTNRVLEYADGLPLAVERLGSCLHGLSVAEWRNFLDREQIIPPYEIMMVLRKCFDELDNMTKEMFLDIACFFIGKDIDCVSEILHDCGFSAEIGIKLLIEKSLVTISNQRIQMHSMLQAMGREIVRQECPRQPEKQSRLYLFYHIKYVLEIIATNRAIEEVEAIVLDLEEPEEDLEEPETTTLGIENLSHLSNLRLLIFRNVKFSGTLNDLPSKLQYISWHEFPFTRLPSFQSDTLVQLIMPNSNLTEAWKGKMMLPNLRKMNLYGSKTLIKTPDFGGVPNLERLNLEGCTGLLELDPSIAELSMLKFLNLRNCINLISIPNRLFALNSLEILNLAGCSELAHCLNFSPLKSLTEVKLLSFWSNPVLENFLYFLLFVLAEKCC